MADLTLYGTPNRSSMRLATILPFQLPRSKPLSCGVPSKSPSMVRSCSGFSSRGLPGLLPSCLPSRPSRSILDSHRWMVLMPRPMTRAILSSVLPCFLSMAA